MVTAAELKKRLKPAPFDPSSPLGKTLAGGRPPGVPGVPAGSTFTPGKGPLVDPQAPTPPKVGKGDTQAGNAFIRAREKAESKGATKREAAKSAAEQVFGVGLDQFEPGKKQELLDSLAGAARLDEEGQLSNADFGGALTAGLGQGAIGAGAGAVVAGAATAGVGAPVGAAIGFGTGFIRGVTSELKEDAGKNIEAQFTTLSTNSGNMRKLVIDAKTDPQGAVDAFTNQLNAIDKAYQNTKLESQRNLNKLTGGDAITQLAKFEDFYAPGGLREIYIGRMQAILTDPSSDVSDLLVPSDFEAPIQ